MLRESALLDKLRSGDAAAFEDLVREYGGRMRAVAYRLLMDEADADDALQDAFLSAFRSIGTFEGRATLGTWLHRITINAALARLRAESRRQETDLDGLLPEFTDTGVFVAPQVSRQEGADEGALRDELSEQIQKHIAELPATYRTPLILRDIEGLAHREVAEALGITENAAKVRVHRGRQALRTLLEPHLRESE